jgi:hypothetical protein
MATEEELKGDLIDLSKAPLVEPEDGVFESYANVVNFNWTLTDVRIRFGELVQQSAENSRGTWSEQEVAILERAAITLPWHQAKILCTTLVTLVKNYEELNGELKQIRLPKL